MKIISKRAKVQQKVSPEVSKPADTIIIVNGGQVSLSPEELKSVEEIFENIRRQLQGIDLKQVVYDGGFW